ncbi:MAG: AtpZ/AtpI family protein [Phycisphaerales bacterium]|nr:AtpZ/AtpI family protein [Phycisphaerales bacterium]
MKRIGPGSNDDKETRVGWRMAGLGGETVSHVLAGGAIGWFLDNWFGTDIWLGIGFIAGIATGLLALIRGGIKLYRTIDAPRKPSQEPPRGDEGGR